MFFKEGKVKPTPYRGTKHTIDTNVYISLSTAASKLAGRRIFARRMQYFGI
jgi:hypothetical protein